MSDEVKQPSVKLKTLLEKPIALAKKEFGEKWDTRYRCPVKDEYERYCSESSKQPDEYHRYCSKHGNLIDSYQTQVYATQPWQEALNEYFYEIQQDTPHE